QDVRLAAISADMVDVLPQFRGYSYFATSTDVYVVDTQANRVVAFFPVKQTAIASRPAPMRSTTGTALAEPAAAPTVTATGQPEAAPPARTTRTARRGDGLAGIEAAVDREMARRGIASRSTTGQSARAVVVEDAGPVTVQRSTRWFPWFGGGRRVYEADDA